VTFSWSSRSVLKGGRKCLKKENLERKGELRNKCREGTKIRQDLALHFFKIKTMYICN
jgi:hypothetical protein